MALMGSVVCSSMAQETAGGAAASAAELWADFFPGKVIVSDRSAASAGSRIWHSILPDPDAYISGCARQVLATLYVSPDDEVVPELREIRYTLQDYNGISEKWGSGNMVGIRYSTRWVERCFGDDGDTVRVDYESRGVLYHELTHAYQLEPKNCGTYSDGGEYWAFIEGMADAVRLACGGFGQEFSSKDRPRGGDWRKGYRYAGYFLFWLQQTKDSEFLHKFNRSAAELETWSWDAAMKHIFGDKPEITADALWNEYITAVDGEWHQAEKM